MLRDVSTWHVAVRIAMLAAAACGTDDPTEPPEMLPPPPANAVASCVYQLASTDVLFPDRDPPTSTLWLDASNRVIRVDGWRFTDAGHRIPAAYDLTWDAEGRLVTLQGKDYDLLLVYSADEVLETSSAGGDAIIHHLVNGKDVRIESPPNPGSNQVSFTAQTYDAAGRLASQNNGVTDLLHTRDTVTLTKDFTYDANGRLATFHSSDTRQFENSKHYSFFYIESADRLIVNVIDIHYPPTPLLAQTWTFEFDANHRLVRNAVDRDGDGYDDFWDDIRYLDGEIDVDARAPDVGSVTHAKGRCDAPSVILAPVASLPIQFQSRVPYRSLPVGEAARALADLGAAGSLVSFP